MSDSDTERPERADEPRVLGRLPAGPYDSGLRPEPSSRERQQEQPAQSHERLQRGVWVRLRSAGGFVFRRSELMISHSGRLSYTSSGAGMYGDTRVVRQLTDDQLEVLRQTIDATIFETTETTARFNPDAVAYELRIRNGRRIDRAEAVQGSVPEGLTQLIRLLGQFARVAVEEAEV